MYYKLVKVDKKNKVFLGVEGRTASRLSTETIGQATFVRPSNLVHIAYSLLIILLNTSFVQVLFAQTLPQTSYPQEKIYVHLDKPAYVTGENIWFSIYCMEEKNNTLSSLSSVAYIELWNSSGEGVFKEKIALKSGKGTGQLYIDASLTSGIYTIRAYTIWMKNEDHALFFEQSIYIFNPFSDDNLPKGFNLKSLQNPPKNRNIFFTVNVEKKQYIPRERVFIDFQVANELIKTETANISISAYAFDPKFSHRLSNIEKYLFARSKIKEEKSNHNNPAHSQKNYLPEIQTPYLDGRINVFPDSLKGRYLFVSFLGESNRLYAVKLDDNGNFSISVSPRIENQDMVFWMENHKLSDDDIIIHDPFAASSAQVLPYQELMSIDTNWLNYIDRLSLSSQISNAYATFSHIHGQEASSKPEPTSFYGQADVSYRLDDYTRFPTMDEVFLEYIRYVYKKRKNKQQQFYIWDLYANLNLISNTSVFDAPAMTMIDGVPIANLETVWNFDPLKVEQIDIVTKEYYANGAVFFGIVNLLTYKHNFGGQALPIGVVQKQYQPLLKSRGFYSPQYATQKQKDNRIPDYRSLLYWNPHINFEVNKSLKRSFFTSDIKGKYKIVINGITESGQPLYAETVFEVK